MATLGGCGEKITREHFVSRNILERITTDTLHFENARHFFGGKDVTEIGIDAFSAKVLCDQHNSRLTDLDTSAGLALESIESLADDFSRLNTLKSDSFRLCSGIDMERWMVKVYCGLVAAKKIRSKSGQMLKGTELDPQLLQALVGNIALPAPMGLYIHRFAGQTVAAKRLQFGTIQLTGSDGVGGFMLSLGVMNFVLVTSQRYGETFYEKNWYRHQELAWNLKSGQNRMPTFSRTDAHLQEKSRSIERLGKKRR
jgi:hypothetical protein